MRKNALLALVLLLGTPGILRGKSRFAQIDMNYPDVWELMFVGLVAMAVAWLWKHPNR